MVAMESVGPAGPTDRPTCAAKATRLGRAPRRCGARGGSSGAEIGAKLAAMGAPMGPLAGIRRSGVVRWPGLGRPGAGWPDTGRSSLVVALAAVVLSALVGLVLVKLGTVQRELKALLIVVAGIAMALAALRPRLGLAMFLALMPFEYHFSGTGTDELLMVAMALVLAWRIRWSAVPTWVAFASAAVVLGSFAAAVGASDQTLALWGGVRWLSAALVMFAAFSILRGDPRAGRQMVGIFTASAVVVVLFAFAQKAGVYLLVGSPFIAGRPSSFFGYYTNYAGYAAMASVLATGELLTATLEHDRTRAAVYAGALVFLLSGIAISISRGGLLALGAGWLIFLVLNARRGRVLLQALSILTIFLVSAFLVTPRSAVVEIEKRFAAPLGTLAEDRERFDIQAAGQKALESYPFGLGYGNFALYARANVRSASIHEKFTHAQSTPIQVGLDAGWIGLVGFFVLVGGALLVPITRGDANARTVRASACAAALGGFLAQGLFDYLFYEIAFVAFVAVLVWGAVAPYVGRGRAGERADGPAGGRADGPVGGRADGPVGGRADGPAGGRAGGRAGRLAIG